MGGVISRASWPSSLLPGNQPLSKPTPTDSDVEQPKVVVQAEDCHILRLPPELRLYIYKYVLDNTTLALKLNGGANARGLAVRRKRRYEPPPLRLSIFQTCKLIHAEAAAMIWARVSLIVGQIASIREIAVKDPMKANIEYRESRLKRLVAVVPEDKLQHIERLEFYYFTDLVQLLNLENDIRKLRGLEASEEVMSIGQLLKGIRTIKVSAPFVCSRSRSYHFWSQDPARKMARVFSKLSEVFIVDKGRVERLEVSERE